MPLRWLQERTFTMGSLKGLVLMLCAAQVIAAQPAGLGPQEIQRARQLLTSPQWMTRAWGAYFAGRLHSEELHEFLIQQFAPAALLRDSPPYSQEYAFVTVLLDAAVEAGVTVPAVLLEPFEERWTAAALILLARDKDNEEPLLKLRAEKSRDAVWLAANNLLLEKKSQPWYEALLGEIKITHRFDVTDPGYGGGSWAGGGGGVCGDGIAAMPKGFPPVTLYTLQGHGARGNVLLARGPRNAYYKRTVVPTDRQVGFGSCFSPLDRGTIRIGYLAELRGESAEQTERLFRARTHIQYTGAEDFERAVERSIRAQELDIREFVQAIEKAGLRAPDIRLRIEPEVNDARQKAKEPLPTVPARSFDLLSGSDMLSP